VPAHTDVGNVETEISIYRRWRTGRYQMVPVPNGLSLWMGCKVQIKVYDGPAYTALEVLGEHDEDSHSSEKERSISP
jgi:hypothetical protein